MHTLLQICIFVLIKSQSILNHVVKEIFGRIIEWCLLTSILAYIAFTFAVSLLSHGHAARITRVALNCSTRWFTKDSEELRYAEHDVASQRLYVKRKQSRKCFAKLLVSTIHLTSAKIVHTKSLSPFCVYLIKSHPQVFLRSFGKCRDTM